MGKSRKDYKFRWYLDKFGSQFKELCELRKSADQNGIQKIDATIEVLRNLMFDGDIFDEFAKEDLINKLDLETELFGDVSDFVEIAESIADEPYLFPKKRYVFSPVISKGDLFDIVYDFYISSVDKDLFNIFRAHFKMREKYVHFERLAERDTVPCSIYLPYYNKSHIRLKRTKDLGDATDLIHEYGHTIRDFINFDVNVLKDNYIFSEVVSLFFELLGIDFLRGNDEFSAWADAYQKWYFDETADKMGCVLEEIQVLKIWQAASKYGNKKRFREVKKEYSLEFLEELFDKSPQYDFIYVVGYLLAVEFFILYQKDRDWTLFLLKEFMAIDLRLPPREFYRKVLDLGITPREHIEDYKRHIILPKGSK